MSVPLPETESVPFEERDGEPIVIDGSAVVRKILLLREGWELDEDGWILEDGRVFGTNHNRLCELDEADIERVMEKVAASLSGLIAARAAMKGRRADTEEEAITA